MVKNIYLKFNIFVTQSPNNDIIFIFFRKSEDSFCNGCFYFFFYELKSSGERQYLSVIMYYVFGCDYVMCIITGTK